MLKRFSNISPEGMKIVITANFNPIKLSVGIGVLEGAKIQAH